MERRTFLALPLAALTLPGVLAAAPVPAAAARPGALKGAACGGTDALALHQIQALNASWYYSWGSTYTVTTNPGFVPMVWSGKALIKNNSVGDVIRQLPVTRTKNLLGFNEPDYSSQANMSVDEAIRLWPQLQSTGLRLGSPCTVSPTSPWLDKFMTKAARANLRVDFMTMHSYGWPNAESFLSKVRNLHDKYERPVWVTEFSVADWSATPSRPSRHTRTEVHSFMRATVAGMRAMPFVERFAWYAREPSDPALGPSALYQTNGQLTAAGRIYATL
jgi:hypothetical protein